MTIQTEPLKIAVPGSMKDLGNYVSALVQSGAQPTLLFCGDDTDCHGGSGKIETMDYRAAAPEAFDGLLLPGGADIDPAFYGEENTASRHIDLQLDQMQFAVLDAFVKAGKPVFGICRGLQMINVYFSGSLIQDIETASHHLNQAERKDLFHESRASNGSWLSHLYGSVFLHNSSHHQALGRLGEGIAVDCRSTEDGVIEAAHHLSLPVFGVQWHPERIFGEGRKEGTADGRVLFRYFLEMCGEHGA